MTFQESDNVQTTIEQVEAEMRALFGDDSQRIEHAMAVYDGAERIRAGEGGDELVIRTSALLHDIGIPEAERVHGSCAGNFQEIEGPPIARKILEKLGVADTAVDHICRIVGSHHSANDIDTIEFRAIWDADWLVNIPDMFPDASVEKLSEVVNRVFKTPTGLTIASARFLLSDPQ